MKKDKFDVIINENKDKIYNYLLKILRNREDAEDIFQQTFLEFYKKYKNVKPEFYTAYLFRTAHNRALDFIKKRNKMIELPQDYENMISQPEPEHIDNNKIKNAFLQLPLNQATALELKFYHKKKYKEIAEIMNTTESSVESLLVRARKKLKKILSQDLKRKEVLKNEGGKNGM